MGFPELSAEKLASLFICGMKNPSQRPVLLLGAGASIPSLPSAYNLKVDIATNALKQAYYKNSNNETSLSEADEKELQEGIAIIESKCEQHHITLEVLVSLITFRSNETLNTDAMWSALCQDSSINEFSFMIALLIKFNCISRILTSNFDRMLEDACEKVGTKNYKVISNIQLDDKYRYDDSGLITEICPFHGTSFEEKHTKYTEPFTATATGLAKPFSKKMSEYIQGTINDQARPIIVFGYSGNDHFDLNPLLSQLRLNESSTKRDNWYWVVHDGNSRNVSNAIQKIFGVDSRFSDGPLYGGNTLELIQRAFKTVKKEFANSNQSIEVVIPDYQFEPARTTYKERLAFWFSENFDWSKKEANNMILDLKNNLVAAWIVSEHYRLVQLGYDEEYSFRFAGVFDIDSSSRDIGIYPHLSLQFETQNETRLQVEFGYILEAARIYRIEMNDPDQKFEVTSNAMNIFIKQAKNAIDYSPRKDSETAALLIGLSIAYDYLGLIGGRKVTTSLKKLKKMKQGNEGNDSGILEEEKMLNAARLEASNGFEYCIKYATLAQKTMTSTLDKLIPAATWIQVGTDNMGRFKVPGSDEAIYWLTKAIDNRKKMIENEIKLSKMNNETDVSTSKIVSVEMHFPPLWRRGGELVQQILETHGFNSAPTKLVTELNKERKKLLKFGFETSENAYKRHQQWNSVPNNNFPAVYDCRVLVALANNDVVGARRAVLDCRSELRDLPSTLYSEAKIKSLETWVSNIEARIEDFISKRGATKESICSQCVIL